MGMYERITNLRKKADITEVELEQKASVGHNSMRRWNENIPSIDKVARVAQVLGTTTDYLFTGIEENAPEIAESFVTYPILSEVAAGYEHIAYESWDNGNVDVPETWLRGRQQDAYFVLEVRGDSMHPTYQNGDLLLVLKQDYADYSGQVVVALYDDENATIKKLEFDQSRTWYRFTPINQNYTTKTLRGEEIEHFRVLGIPKKLIRNIED